MIKGRVDRIEIPWRDISVDTRYTDYMPAAAPVVTGVIWNTNDQIEFPVTFELSIDDLRTLADLTYGIIQRSSLATKYAAQLWKEPAEKDL